MTERGDNFCSHCLLPIGLRGMQRTVNGEECAFCCYGCCIAFQVKNGKSEEWEAAWLLIRLGVLLLFLAGTFAIAALCATAAWAGPVCPAVVALRVAPAATVVATSAGAFLIPVAVDAWRGAAGFFAGATSAISMPNTSARCASSSTLPVVGLCLDLRRPAPACATRSLGSTRRNAKISSGWLSRRAPTPYSTAATCLHMDAQSGQLQLN